MNAPLRQPAPPDAREEQRAVSAILERDADMRARIAKLEADRARPRPWMGVLVGALLAGGAYVWFGDPPFLREKRPEPPPARQLHAGARFAMYLVACRIEDYRVRHGTTPADLRRLGSVPDGITYLRRTDRYYVLRYGGLEEPIVYDSEFGNLAQLSGASLDVIGTLAPDKQP
jgi:hypothetical protein